MALGCRDKVCLVSTSARVLIFNFCKKKGPLSIKAVFDSKLSKNGFYTEGSYFFCRKRNSTPFYV
jgi:hypothetical protein